MELASIIGTTAAVFTSWLFAMAGWHKLRPSKRDYYAGVFSGYGIRLQPNGMLKALPAAVGLTEIAVAVAVLIPSSRWLASWVAASILISYGLLMARQLKTGRSIECGCGGGGEGLKISGHLLIRNAVFSGIALLGLLPIGSGLGLWVLACLSAGVWVLVSASSQQLINNVQKLHYT